VFDNPDLLACCVVGDGEAETGATGNQLAFQQVSESCADGAVLPILHLNGYRLRIRLCWRA